MRSLDAARKKGGFRSFESGHQLADGPEFDGARAKADLAEAIQKGWNVRSAVPAKQHYERLISVGDCNGMAASGGVYGRLAINVAKT